MNQTIFKQKLRGFPYWIKNHASSRKGTFLALFTGALLFGIFADIDFYRDLFPSSFTAAQRKLPSKGDLIMKGIHPNPQNAVANATLVQVIDTSSFSPASPDPSGVTYLAETGRLLIADSEVDETTGAGFHNVNMWEITPTGTVVATGNTLSWPLGETVREPTGLSYDPVTQTLFVSNDDTDRIYIVQRGVDGLFGTPDDIIGEIDTSDIFESGPTDAEDPAFDPVTGHLFFLNGASTQVWRLDPVNGVFGDGDDIASHFDFGSPTATDAEAMDINLARGTLMVGTNGRRVLEFTKDGTLLRTIDFNTVTGLTRISGMTIAPASDGSGQMNYWVVDRGVDNDNTPTENDGKLFEIAIPAAAPVVDSVTLAPAAPKTNDVLTASATANDEDGDPLTLSYQWLKNGGELAGQTGQTLDLSVLGNGDKSDLITVRVTASDGTNNSAPHSATVQIVNSSPIVTANNRENSENEPINISLAAVDPDGDELTYVATGLPPGLSINPATGQVTGTVAEDAADAGPYAVQLTVSEAPTAPTPAIALIQLVTPASPSVLSVTTEFPSVPTEGNLLVALGRVGSGRSVIMPEGWEVIVPPQGSTPLPFAYYKIAGPAEPQSVTMEVTGNVSPTNANLSLFEYSGLVPVKEVVLGPYSAPGRVVDVTSATTGAVTTTQPNQVLIAAIHLGANRAWNNAWTNGFVRLNTQPPTTTGMQSFAHLFAADAGTYSSTESWAGTITTANTTLVSFNGLTALPTPEPVAVSFTWTILRQSPSAARVWVSGRVVSASGRGLSNVVITVTGSDGLSYSVTTNTFGYYKIGQLRAGDAYLFSPVTRRYTFSPQFVTLNEDVAGLDFVAFE